MGGLTCKQVVVTSGREGGTAKEHLEEALTELRDVLNEDMLGVLSYVPIKPQGEGRLELETW